MRLTNVRTRPGLINREMYVYYTLFKRKIPAGIPYAAANEMS